MTDDVIMLAKEIDYSRIQYPVSVFEKLDGVASDLYKPLGTNLGDVLVRARSGDPLYSVQHIQDALKVYLKGGEHFIGELYIQGKKFKDISGKVRGHDNAPELKLMIYDFYSEGSEELHYIDRMAHLLGLPKKNPAFMVIPGTYIQTEEALRKWIGEFLKDHPDAEGVVVRSHHGKDSTYRIGKRSWGLMRFKRTQTLDLRVKGFEEAISKDGKPLGMVGRINVEYKGVVSGVGPGKLTHDERRAIWNDRESFLNQIAEVKAMVDPSYNALREGRFYRWRPDKTEPSEE